MEFNCKYIVYLIYLMGVPESTTESTSEYQGQLYEQGIRPSMSRKGNCWDNAAIESFFARMKVESIYAERFQTKDDAYACVFEYIELFYNSVRRHSAIDYKSPRQYEEDYYAQCA